MRKPMKILRSIFVIRKSGAAVRNIRHIREKYPVIYVTFKDVKCETWEATYDLIYKILRNEFERHSELLDSDKISAYEKKYITSILEGDANENDVAMAFKWQIITVHRKSTRNFANGMMDNRYHITSNREAGNGRFDIQMLPLNKKLPGILIEWKALKDCSAEQLEELAQTALKQMDERQYYAEMNAQGVGEILKYGIAFSGKNVCVKAEIRI